MGGVLWVSAGEGKNPTTEKGEGNITTYITYGLLSIRADTLLGSAARGYCSCHTSELCGVHGLTASEDWDRAYQAYIRVALVAGRENDDLLADEAERYARQVTG